MTLTHIRFFGSPGVYELEIMSDANGPLVTLASAEHSVSATGMQIVPLDAPLTLNGALTFWIALSGTNDYWTASGDVDGQDTANLIYFCLNFGGACFTPPEWGPYEALDLFGDAWGSWGDIVADVGFSEGEIATCE